MAEKPGLTKADVHKLLQDHSGQSRAGTAAKLARAFNTTNFRPVEQVIAGDIFRIMMRDAEQLVRQALAENLKTNPNVPRDIALSLAADVDAVSAPILQFSTILNDADLIEILGSASPAKQTAIARRAGLSEDVARTIASTAGVRAVATLMGNEKAAVPEDAFDTALTRFGEVAPVQNAMVHRRRLPVGVAEKLVALVSESLREHLMVHHDMSADLAADLLLQVRERATVSLALSSAREELPQLIDRLHRNGRLTHGIVLRALCTGDFDFFECAMAGLARIPAANASQLIYDKGGLGLARLIEHCGMSKEFLFIAQTAIEVSRELQYDGRPDDRERFAARMMERILTSFPSEFEDNSLEYLFGKLSKIPLPTACLRL
jgi:uncharacterized protein (DUF2336 family)